MICKFFRRQNIILLHSSIDNHVHLVRNAHNYKWSSIINILQVYII